MFFVFPRAIAPDACDEIVKDCKKNILEDALVANYGQVAGGEKYSRDDPNLRKTSISFITDKNNKINELIWGFLREANRKQFNYELTYFQAIQFAEYTKGSFFDWHQDDAGISKTNETRKLSLSFILSDPDTFKGGELQFYNGDRPIPDRGKMTGERVKNDIKSQGTVIVFDSHDWHRVTPVTEGIRHSIVCWCVGPNFK